VPIADPLRRTVTAKGRAKKSAAEEGRGISGRRAPFDDRSAHVVEHAQSRDAGDARQRLDPFACGDGIVEDERGLDAIGTELGRQLHVAVGITAKRSDARKQDRQPRKRHREQCDSEMEPRQQLLQCGARADAFDGSALVGTAHRAPS